jgi:hypothetical protein
MNDLIAPFSAIFIGTAIGISALTPVQNLLNSYIEHNCRGRVETVTITHRQLKHCVRT